MPDSDFYEQLWMAGHLDSMREMYDRQTRHLLNSLFEVADGLEQLRREAAESKLSEPWQTGIRIMEKKLRRELQSAEVRPISAEPGAAVDPRLHRIVKVVSGAGPSSTIVRQLRTGYVWKDLVLRPADIESAGAETDGDETNGKFNS